MEAMLRTSFGWWYILSTPSVKGAGKVSRSTTAVATFWLALAKARHCVPSWLMAAVTSLAQAQEVVRSTIRLRSASSTDFRWCSMVSWTSMAAHSLGSLPHCCIALRSAMTCRVRARTCCSS
jgi:hypothetical protein